jgi:hypothetical protein
MRLLKTFRDEELDLSEKSGFADRLEKFRKTGSEDR